MILYLTKISIFFSLKKEFWLCIMSKYTRINEVYGIVSVPSGSLCLLVKC